MWIFAKHGFFSIVEHKDNSNLLMVRARAAGDIEYYWPDAEVLITPNADYLYRTTLARKVVAARIARAVDDIDSPQFKPTVAKERASFYARVHMMMARMQATLATRKIHRATASYLQ